ncbi:MAG: hypothetical protein ACPGYT_02495 [Nitrospirales bacterium]
MSKVRCAVVSLGGALLILMFVQVVAVSFSVPSKAYAIPAFARKYAVNCHVCHTRWPRLNPFGEQFLENGYQLPGTEDGGLVGKARYGDLTLDQVSHYFAVLFAGSAIESVELAKRPSGVSSEDKTEFTFPGLLRIYTAGTLSKNIGFLPRLSLCKESMMTLILNEGT